MTKEKIVIDLSDASLNEAYIFSDFSKKVNYLLQDLYYAGIDIPVSIQGTSDQIESFYQALRGEKRYMDSYMKHGLSDGRTLNDRHRLMGAVADFERETGLRWPFKN